MIAQLSTGMKELAEHKANAIGAIQIAQEVTLCQAIAQEITMLTMALAQSFKSRQQLNAQGVQQIAVAWQVMNRFVTLNLTVLILLALVEIT